MQASTEKVLRWLPGEVRALAGRSANAVKEIEQLIGDTLRKVSEGHALSEQTRLAMDSIIVHIDNISQLVTEINHASREQSAGIGGESRHDPHW